MPDETAYVQVATDGSGKRIANVSVTQPQAVDSSGNAQADLTRYQQVVTAVDERGDGIDTAWQSAVVAELRAIHEALDLIRLALS